jgi:RimJ/RimL family protein N-acetyltransferase
MWIGAELPLDRVRFRTNFDEFLANTHKARFVAELDGVLVGELGVGKEMSGVAELGMMVRDGHRGAGVGSALMQSCIDWSRDARAHKLTLQMWPHNEAALALYRKFGFVVEGRLVRQWRRRSGELWDAIVMGLVLDDQSPGSPHADAASLYPTTLNAAASRSAIRGSPERRPTASTYVPP